MRRQAPLLGPGAGAAFVIGVALMLAFDAAVTRALGVACLLAFVVAGTFRIADPEYLSQADATEDGERTP